MNNGFHYPAAYERRPPRAFIWEFPDFRLDTDRATL